MKPGADKPEFAEGEKPEKPEKPEMTDGEKPELNCKKVKKALHKAHKHADHAKKVIAPCVEALTACVADSDDLEACTADARQCIKSRAAKAFEMMCEAKLAKCDEGTIPADKCESIATRCEEGPKPPKAPNAPEADDESL